VPRTLSQTQVEDFRDRLIETATRLFAEQGRDGFTMRQLASVLGCSAMTPYRYFKDKDEILAAVRASAFDQFSTVLEAAFDKFATSAERGGAVGDAYVKFAFEHPEAYKLMFDLTQPDEAAYPELVRATARAKKTMTRHVEALVKDGILNGDPQTIGLVMWSALHGAVVLELAGKLSPEFSFETIRDEIVRAIMLAYTKKN
jgi:AcrR family transcriptional regulator